MKPFELNRSMFTLGGQFYPTGHIVAMFPGAEAAESAGRALVSAGIEQDDLSLISPEVMLTDIVRSVANADIPLPSAGTEADTVRRFADYASDGHYALLIHAPDQADSDRVMQALKDHRPSHAQKYRMLVIEDLA